MTSPSQPKASLGRSQGQPGVHPSLVIEAVAELEACERRKTSLGSLVAGQEGWRLLLKIYIDHALAGSSTVSGARASLDGTMAQRWLKVLALEGMIEGNSKDCIMLTARAVQCVEASLAG